MEFGAQADSKKRSTWPRRVLIAFGVVALVVVAMLAVGGSAQGAHVDVNEAMIAPTEVAADATGSAHPEFYISVEKDDAQAPEASEEGELAVFEEQAPVDADEEEKQLEAWNGLFVFLLGELGCLKKFCTWSHRTHPQEKNQRARIPINEMARATWLFSRLKRAMLTSC